MAMKKNKAGLVEEFQKRTGYDLDKCYHIVDILEETFIVGKSNKEKMISDLMEKVSVNEDEANKIYETYIEIVRSGLKERIKEFFTGKKD